MRIIWDNISEIGKYMEKYGLEKICEDEREWGGRGYIIASGGYLSKKEKISTEESKTSRGRGDTIIMTPYAKELSWLFRNLMDYEMEQTQSMRLVEECVWAASTAFFVEHKQYDAEQLVRYVYNFVCSVFRDEEQHNREQETSGK